MFYINLENQIHLLVILIFSSYIYLSSMTMKLDPFMKNLGTAFFIPLVLSIMSFLTLNTVHAESYLFFSEFILIAALLAVLTFKNIREFGSIIFLLLYSFPLAVILLNLNFGSLHKHVVINAVLFTYLGVTLLIIILGVIEKKNSLTVLQTGLFSLCASLVIPRVNTLSIAIVVSLLLKAVSYLFFAFFFRKYSVNRLEEDYIRVSGELARINDNIQREVNRRLAAVEAPGVPLPELVKMDGLTGTYTGKAILDYIEFLIEKDPNGEFSLLLANIVSFGKINSKLGSIAGEKCLKSLGNILKNIAGKDNKIGRFEESGFIVVMPGTNIAKAWYAAEQLVKEAGETNDPHFDVAAGVVSYPMDGENMKELIKAARKALRFSKKSVN